MSEPSLTRITGIAYDSHGAIDPGGYLTILRTVADSPPVTNRPVTVRANNSGELDDELSADHGGVVGFNVLRGSVILVRSSISGWDMKSNGHAVPIPDVPTITLDELLPVPSVTVNTVTTSQLTTEAATRAAADTAEAATRAAADAAEQLARETTDASITQTVLALEGAISDEIGWRTSGDAATLSSANTYADGRVGANMAVAPGSGLTRQVAGNVATIGLAEATGETQGAMPAADRAAMLAATLDNTAGALIKRGAAGEYASGDHLLDGNLITRRGGAWHNSAKPNASLRIVDGATNLLSNSSAETTAILAYYAQGSATQSFTRTQEWAHSGAWSMKWALSNLTSTYGLRLYSSSTAGFVTVEAGKTYAFSAWANILSGTFSLHIVFKNDAGATVGSGSLTSPSNSATGVQRLAVAAVAPAGTVKAELRIRCSVAGTIYWDSFQFEVDQLTDFVDGSMGAGHSWSGAAWASTATRMSRLLLADTLPIDAAGGVINRGSSHFTGYTRAAPPVAGLVQVGSVWRETDESPGLVMRGAGGDYGLAHDETNALEGANFATLVSLFNGFGAAAYRTIVVSRPLALTANVTLNANIHLKFTGSGRIDVGAFSLTINGTLEAPARRIFNWTTGAINFSWNMREVYPEWFGATGDAIADDYLAFVKTIAACPVFNDTWNSRGGVRSNISTTILLGSKSYRFTQKITLNNSRGLYFKGHAAVAARFFYDSPVDVNGDFTNGNFMFRISSGGSPKVFENVAFHKAGIEIEDASRGYKHFVRCLWIETVDWAIQTLGMSVIGMLIDEFWVSGCYGGFSIAYDQSDLNLFRRGSFTYNKRSEIVIASSGCVVEYCDFEVHFKGALKAGDGNGSDWPYCWVQGIGKTLFLGNRFGNENTADGQYDHPREAVIIGGDRFNFTAGIILAVQFHYNIFQGSINSSDPAIAQNCVKLTSPQSGLTITSNNRVQGYGSFRVYERYVESNDVQAIGTSGGNLTDWPRSSFSHGGFAFSFFGSTNTGREWFSDHLKGTQNYLAGTDALSGWSTVGSITRTNEPAGSGFDGISTASRLTRTGSGTVGITKASLPLPAEATEAVVSVWAKEGAVSAGLRLTLQRGNQWLTRTDSVTGTPDSIWRLYFAHIPNLKGATSITVGLFLGTQGSAETTGDLLVCCPMLEINRKVPSVFLPGSATEAHAPTQINSRTLGTRYEGYGLAAPTSGHYNAGDRIFNRAPAELGTTGSKYVVNHWLCLTAGAPGVWVESRGLTGN